MGTFKDLTGQRFGRLTVLWEAEERTPQGGVRWTCKCECKKYVTVRSEHLIRGHTKSCGCFSGECRREWIQRYRWALQLAPRRTRKLTTAQRVDAVLRCRAGEPQSAVAKELGVTRQAVHQLVKAVEDLA